jgi:hypothetical protein
MFLSLFFFVVSLSLSLFPKTPPPFCLAFPYPHMTPLSSSSRDANPCGYRRGHPSDSSCMGRSVSLNESWLKIRGGEAEEDRDRRFMTGVRPKSSIQGEEDLWGGEKEWEERGDRLAGGGLRFLETGVVVVGRGRGVMELVLDRECTFWSRTDRG